MKLFIQYLTWLVHGDQTSQHETTQMNFKTFEDVVSHDNIQDYLASSSQGKDAFRNIPESSDQPHYSNNFVNECDCATTTFQTNQHDKNFMPQKVGGEPQFLVLDIKDSVSLRCGNKDGISFCGKRQNSFLFKGQLIHKWPFKGLEWREDINTLIFLPQIEEDCAGEHIIQVFYTLFSNPKIKALTEISFQIEPLHQFDRYLQGTPSPVENSFQCQANPTHAFMNLLNPGVLSEVQVSQGYLNGNPQNAGYSQNSNTGCDGVYAQSEILSNLILANNYWIVTFPQQDQLVKTVLIIDRDDSAKSQLGGVQITLGNNPDITANPSCVSALTNGGWYTCASSANKGQYFAIYCSDSCSTAGGKVNFSEVMLFYTEQALQLGLSAPLYPTLLSTAVDISSTSKTCFVTPAQTNPTLKLQINGAIKIKGVFLIGPDPGINASTLQSLQDGITVSVQYQNQAIVACGSIQDYSIYHEVDCFQTLANNVILSKTTNPLFPTSKSINLCSIGILSDCDCSTTSLSANDFVTTSDLINTNTIQKEWDDASVIKITVFGIVKDTVSLQCGNLDGYSECGGRSVTITDMNQNPITYPFHGLTFVDNSATNNASVLTLGVTTINDIGSWFIQVKVQLDNYPLVSRIQDLTITIYQITPANECTGAIGQFNLFDKTVFAVQSTFLTGYNTKEHAGCDGVTNLHTQNTAILDNSRIFATDVPVAPAYQYWRAAFLFSVQIETVLIINTNDPTTFTEIAKAKIYIGDKADLVLNKYCPVIKDGGWCVCSLKGQFFGVASNTGYIQFTEVIAYSVYAIQLYGSTAQIDSEDSQFPALNALQSIIVTDPIQLTRQKCISSTSTNNPSFTLLFEAQGTIVGVVFISMDSQSQDAFDNFISVSVTSITGTIQQCGVIDNIFNYAEQKCGFDGNQVVASKSGTNLILGFCGIGVFSQCDCSKTSYNTSLMTTNPAQVFLSSNQLQKVWYDTSVKTLTVNTKLSDTVSLMCGNDGFTFCGTRTVQFYDQNGNRLTLPYLGMTFDSITGKIQLGVTSYSQKGSFQINVKMVLAVGPIYQGQFYLIISATYCSSSAQSLNILRTDTATNQNAFLNGFDVNPNQGCDGIINFYVNGANDLTQLVSTDQPFPSFWMAEFSSPAKVQTVLIINGQITPTWMLSYKITVGQNLDVTLNSVCIDAGFILDGGWWQCPTLLFGQYLAIISESQLVQFMEVMAYSQFVIQMKAVSATVTFQNNAYPAKNSINNLVVTYVMDNLRQTCVASTITTDPTFQLTLKASGMIDGLVLIGGDLNQVQANVNLNSVSAYVTSVSSVNQPCGVFQNYQTYSELACGISGYQIVLKKIGANQVLQFCGLGVLTSCDCSNTSFDISQIPGAYDTLISSILSGLSSYQISLTIPDTVSSICGPADGYSFCGQRVVTFTDNDSNGFTIKSWPYKGYNFFDKSLQLEWHSNTDASSSIIVTISLQKFPKVQRSKQLIQYGKQSSSFSVSNQVMNAVIGKLSVLNLPVYTQATKYTVTSTLSFSVFFVVNSLTVLSNDNLDVGTKVLQMVATQGVNTATFKVFVTFIGSKPLVSLTNEVENNTNNTTAVQNSEESKSNQDTLIDTLDCFIDNKNAFSCFNPITKSTCKIDPVSGQLACDKQVKSMPPKFIPPTRPTVFVTKVNNLGVFSLKFSQKMNFTNLDNTTTQNASRMLKGGGKGVKKNSSKTLEVETSQNTSDQSEQNNDLIYRYLLSPKQLMISAISGGISNQTVLQFTWYALEVTEQEIKIQIDFEYPLYVSSNKGFPDSIQIQLLQSSMKFFKSQDSNLYLLNPLYKKKSMLVVQMPIGQLTNSVNAASQNLESSGQAAIIGNTIMRILLSGSMQQMWTMVNALQLTISFTLLNILMPSNVYLAIINLSDLASFNVFPTNAIFTYVFNFQAQTIPGTGFQHMSYENGRLIYFVGSLYLILIILGLYYLVFGIAYSLRHRYRFMNRLQLKLAKSLFWNPILLYCLESQLDFSIGIMLSYSLYSFDTWSNIFDMIFTILSTPVFAAITPFCFIFLQKNYKNINTEWFKRQYGCLLDGYRHQTVNDLSRSIPMTGWFCFRRLMQAVLIVPLSNATLWVQLTLNMYLCLLDSCIKLHLDPFENKLAGIMDHFNNYIVLFLSYYLFLFTPLILSVDDKYLIGWVFVGIICIMLVANLVAMLLNVFKDLVKRIKLWFVQNHNKLIMKRNGVNALADQTPFKMKFFDAIGIKDVVYSPRVQIDPQVVQAETDRLNRFRLYAIALFYQIPLPQTQIELQNKVQNEEIVCQDIQEIKNTLLVSQMIPRPTKRKIIVDEEAQPKLSQSSEESEYESATERRERMQKREDKVVNICQTFKFDQEVNLYDFVELLPSQFTEIESVRQRHYVEDLFDLFHDKKKQEETKIQETISEEQLRYEKDNNIATIFYPQPTENTQTARLDLKMPIQ